MSRLILYIVVAALAAVPASAQQLAPGVWFGVSTAPDGSLTDQRFEVESRGGRVSIFRAPYGFKPVSWGNVVMGSDNSLQFNWRLAGQSDQCVLHRQVQGDYAGICSNAKSGEWELTLTTREPSHGLELLVTDTDFKILARARERLRSPAVWNRHDQPGQHRKPPGAGHRARRQ